jgi:hypothetical protein
MLRLLEERGITMEIKHQKIDDVELLKMLDDLKNNPTKIHKFVKSFIYEDIKETCFYHSTQICSNRSISLGLIVKNNYVGFRSPNRISVIKQGINRSIDVVSDFNGYNISLKNNGHYLLLGSIKYHEDKDGDVINVSMETDITFLPDSFNFVTIDSSWEEKYNKESLENMMNDKFIKPFDNWERVFDYYKNINDNCNDNGDEVYWGVHKIKHTIGSISYGDCSHSEYSFGDNNVIICNKIGDSVNKQKAHPQVHGDEICFGDDSESQAESITFKNIFNYLRETILNLQTINLEDNSGNIIHSSHSYRNGVLLFNNPTYKLLIKMKMILRKLRGKMDTDKDIKKLIDKFLNIEYHYYDKNCYCSKCLEIKIPIVYGFVYDDYYFDDQAGVQMKLTDLIELMKKVDFDIYTFNYNGGWYDDFNDLSYYDKPLQKLNNELDNGEITTISISYVLKEIVQKYIDIAKYSNYLIELSFFNNYGKIYHIDGAYNEYRNWVYYDKRLKKFYNFDSFYKISEFIKRYSELHKEYQKVTNDYKTQVITDHRSRGTLDKELVKEVNKLTKKFKSIDFPNNFEEYILNPDFSFMDDMEYRY